MLGNRRFWLFALTICAVGCHPRSDIADAGFAPDADVVTCQNDSRVDTYVANLTKKSMHGAYQIVLQTSDPGPPIKGVNTWTIKLQNGSGDPMATPKLEVLPCMPDHGHGTNVNAIISPQADGTLTVTPLYLFMGGVWQVTFDIPAVSTDMGAAPDMGPPPDMAKPLTCGTFRPSDPVNFYFCIPG
jgi:hypothetical protein